MNDFGEMSATGVVLSNSEMKERRLKRGECPTCGIKCFKKTIFKSIPISDHGKVLNGRCLQCRPLDASEMTILPAQVEIASEKDLRRAKKSTSMASFKLGNSRSEMGIRRSVRNIVQRSIGDRSTSDRSTSDRSMSDENVHADNSMSNTQGRQLQRQRSDRESKGDNSTTPSPTRTTSNMARRNSKHVESPGNSKGKNSDESKTLSPKERTSISDVQKTTVAIAASIHLQRKFRNERPKHVSDTGTSSKSSSSSSIESPPSILPAQSQGSRERKDLRTGEEKNSGTPSDIEEDYLDSEELKAVEAIEALSMDTCNLDKILQIGQEFQEDLSVRRQAVNSLCDFISNTKIVESDLKALAEKGGVEMLVHVFDTQCDQVMQLSICQALCNVSTSKEIQLSLGKEGAIQSIIKSIESFPGNKDMLSLCIELLGNLSKQSANADRMASAGGAQKVLETMGSFSDSTPIQEACINAIIMMSRSDLLRKEILLANGASQISITIVMFSNDVHILNESFRALRSLSTGDSKNKEMIIDSGAIDSIVSAMQLHRDDPKIQSSAAWTLGDIGSTSDTAKRVGDCGGIDLITRALYVHYRNEIATEKLCKALEDLSNTCIRNQILMIEIEVIDAVICAMQNQTDNAAIQTSCLGILSNLSKSNANVKLKIIESEGLDSISMSMVIHADVKDLQRNACSVLRNLICDATVDSLLAMGVTELMNTASMKFPGECSESTRQAMAIFEDLR